MESDIKKILNGFLQLKNSQRQFGDFITEELNDYDFSLKTSDVLSNLDLRFVQEVEPFIKNLREVNCQGTFTSGYRTTGKNVHSLHRKGQALDLRLPSDDCYCQAMNICVKYPNLFCLDERKNITQDWTAPHLHVSLPQKKGVTKPCSDQISKSADPNMAKVDTKGPSGTPPNSTTTNNYDGSDYDDDGIEKDTGLGDIALQAAKFLTGKLKESISLGNNPSYSYGSTTIPSSGNKRIFSPIDGYVDNSSYISGCNNILTLVTDDFKYKIVYCNISDVIVNNGDSVSKGTVIGSTDSDVTVKVYDKKGRAIDPSSVMLSSKKTSRNKNKPTDGEDENDEKRREPVYSDPALAMLFKLPFTPFLNKYDKKTGKLIKKNWASPTEKTQPDKIRLDKKIFKSPTKDDETKLDEEIVRIKQLLK